MAQADSGGGIDLNIGQTPAAPYPTRYTGPQLGLPTGPEIGAAGSGLEAFAALAQGIVAAKRAKAIAGYNADVAEANAQAQAQAAELEALQLHRQALIAQQDMVLAQEAQTWREARGREQQERILGQTRAIVGASGLLMEGSPLAVYEETIRQAHLDVAAQRYQTQLQQRASGEQATQAEYGATLARWGAGERLRVGHAQAGLLRNEPDETQVGAGLLRAGAAVTKGAGTYLYETERQKANQTLIR
jgi:hypothetical protein